MKIHIVQKGDTLWKIAKKYGVDFEELKSMNTQLSNPDLIMPGMKIKVPSGNVAIKKEQVAAKKETAKGVHPFAKEKPKDVLGVEDTSPKEPITEKPSKPYIPPVPKVEQPVYPGVDVNNYYTLNMAMLQQMPKPPQLPSKPGNVLAGVEKDQEPVKDAKKPYQPTQQSPQEEALKDMDKKGKVPGEYSPEQFVAPQYMVPVSPILPGSGLCPPGYYHPMPYGYAPGYAPAIPNPGVVSPGADTDGDESGAYPQNVPLPDGVNPAYFNFPVNPYAGVPVSPVMPGSGLDQQQSGAREEDDDQAYENENEDYSNQYVPYQLYPQAVFPDYRDCGCGGAAPAYPYQQGLPYGYQMQQPYGGYPMQQPYGGYPTPMAPQSFPYGYSQYHPQQFGHVPYPYPQQQYGAGQNPMPQSSQMFGMPNLEEDREEDQD